MEGEIVHYEIPAKNVEKLKTFYSKVLGWKFNDSGMPGMTYLIMRAKDAPKKSMGVGGMYKKSKAGQTPVNYMSVKNIDATVEKLKKSGGKLLVPKQPIPKMGWSAMGKDPEGNPIAFFQFDLKAGTKKK